MHGGKDPSPRLAHNLRGGEGGCRLEHGFVLAASSFLSLRVVLTEAEEERVHRHVVDAEEKGRNDVGADDDGLKRRERNADVSSGARIADVMAFNRHCTATVSKRLFGIKIIECFLDLGKVGTPKFMKHVCLYHTCSLQVSFKMTPVRTSTC